MGGREPGQGLEGLKGSVVWTPSKGAGRCQRLGQGFQKASRLAPESVHRPLGTVLGARRLRVTDLGLRLRYHMVSLQIRDSYGQR